MRKRENFFFGKQLKLFPESVIIKTIFVFSEDVLLWDLL